MEDAGIETEGSKEIAGEANILYLHHGGNYMAVYIYQTNGMTHLDVCISPFSSIKKREREDGNNF